MLAPHPSPLPTGEGASFLTKIPPSDTTSHSKRNPASRNRLETARGNVTPLTTPSPLPAAAIFWGLLISNDRRNGDEGTSHWAMAIGSYYI